VTHHAPTPLASFSLCRLRYDRVHVVELSFAFENVLPPIRAHVVATTLARISAAAPDALVEQPALIVCGGLFSAALDLHARVPRTDTSAPAPTPSSGPRSAFFVTKSHVINDLSRASIGAIRNLLVRAREGAAFRRVSSFSNDSSVLTFAALYVAAPVGWEDKLVGS
jgi:hypothetical protein